MTNVLIVEDEPDLRLLTQLVLEGHGYDVSEAHDGEAALDLLLAAHSVDVVLLDLRMPGISGWEVLDRLRDAGLVPALPVVVFSAHMEPRETERAIGAGARSYLNKPFTDEQLLAALSAAASS